MFYLALMIAFIYLGLSVLSYIEKDNGWVRPYFSYLFLANLWMICAWFIYNSDG